MAEKENKEKKIQDKTINPLKRAMNRVAATKDGQTIFKWLMKECAFGESSICIDQNSMEINKDATLYMESRKTVYYKIRNLIEPKYLKEIEFENEEEN